MTAHRSLSCESHKACGQRKTATRPLRCTPQPSQRRWHRIFLERPGHCQRGGYRRVSEMCNGKYGTALGELSLSIPKNKETPRRSRQSRRTLRVWWFNSRLVDYSSFESSVGERSQLFFKVSVGGHRSMPDSENPATGGCPWLLTSEMLSASARSVGKYRNGFCHFPCLLSPVWPLARSLWHESPRPPSRPVWVTSLRFASILASIPG